MTAHRKLARSARQFRQLLLALGAAWLTLPAVAVPVYVEYTGVVSTMTYSDCRIYSGYCQSSVYSSPASSGLYEGLAISRNDPFSGGFTYDTSAPLTATSAEGNTAYYSGVSDEYFRGGQIDLPSASLPSFGGGEIIIGNNFYGSDRFAATSTYFSSTWFAMTSVTLLDLTAQRLSSLEIPESLDISEFGNNQFFLAFIRQSDGDQLHVFGTLSSLKFSTTPPVAPAQVPEPPIVALLGLGLIAAAGALRYRRRAGIASEKKVGS